MRSETRLFRFFNKFFTIFKEKFLFFQNSFSSAVFFLFIGFLGGNLFGTFLSWIRTFFPWDGFIVLSFLFFIEVISYIRYHRYGRSFLFFWMVAPRKSFNFLPKAYGANSCAEPYRQQKIKNFKEDVVWKILNFFKIGLMVGFFIDAFKVGS